MQSPSASSSHGDIMMNLRYLLITTDEDDHDDQDGNDDGQNILLCFCGLGQFYSKRAAILTRVKNSRKKSKSKM